MDVDTLRKRSAHGDGQATFALAEYLRGRSMDVSQEVISLYVLASEQGASVAANCLGALYEEEGSPHHDLAKAVYWYTIACEGKESLACTRLGIAYMGGQLGLVIDTKRAHEYIKKAQSITNGIFKDEKTGDL